MENLKTIILTNNQNKNFKAILNLKGTRGKIKFFNTGLIKSNLALGLKTNCEIIKIPLEIKDNVSVFTTPTNVCDGNGLLCAVVDVSNAFCPELVLSGSVNSQLENRKIESAFAKTKPDDISNLYEYDTDAEIENLVENNLKEDENNIYFDCCAECKYRKAFYDEGDCGCAVKANNKENLFNNKSSEGLQVAGISKEDLAEEVLSVADVNDANETEALLSSKEVLNESIEKEDVDLLDGYEDIVDDQEFYFQVKPQLDALFNKYQKEEFLANIIANSNWVKVSYDGGQEYYVLGLIFSQTKKDKVDFICYGVPSKNKNDPPEDIKEYAQWLPIKQGGEEGFFIVYQKASDGQTVNVEYV